MAQATRAAETNRGIHQKGNHTLRETEDRYYEVLTRIVTKCPEIEHDLNELDNLAMEMIVQSEDGVIRRHGEQIMAMIRGDLYQHRGSMAPDFMDAQDREDLAVLRSRSSSR